MKSPTSEAMAFRGLCIFVAFIAQFMIRFNVSTSLMVARKHALRLLSALDEVNIDIDDFLELPLRRCHVCVALIDPPPPLLPITTSSVSSLRCIASTNHNAFRKCRPSFKELLIQSMPSCVVVNHSCSSSS